MEGVTNVEGVANVEGEANVKGYEANVEGSEVNAEGETYMEGEETDDVESHNKEVLNSSVQAKMFSNSSLDTFVTGADFGIDDTGFNVKFVEENDLERANLIDPN